MELLDGWDAHSEVLRTIDPAALQPITGGRLVAPITYPRTLLCAGANYYDHAAEMGTARPDPDALPFFFLKPPTTTVVGPDTDVALPPGRSDVDWEAELAVVIGRGGRDIPADRAYEHIAGYTAANDLSARGLFSREDAVFPPFAWDWLRHKGFDGSCPLGPGIVPAWQIPEPQDLALSLSVNGETKQDSSTAAMVIPIARLVAGASSMVTLQPGDVILTGTPAGVGMPRKTFLSAGDIVEVQIEGIGRLRTMLTAG